jgi:hypothetical protein
MQQFILVRGVMQQPLMVVLGVLTGAGAAKSGHGAWAAGGIIAFLSIHVGSVVTFVATRSLAAWVARMRRQEALAWSGCDKSGDAGTVHERLDGKPRT